VSGVCAGHVPLVALVVTNVSMSVALSAVGNAVAMRTWFAAPLVATPTPYSLTAVFQ